MAQTYSALRDLVEQILQDTSNGIYEAAEVDLHMADGLRELPRYVPNKVIETLTVEARHGSATSTSSGNLVDTGNSQFVSGDVGKIVYNDYDQTWAVITTYTSTSQVALSKDIMTSGETYKIFNAGCYNAKQINLSDITDRIEVLSVEFPYGHKRNWELNGDILTIGLDYTPISTKEANSDKNVYITFNKRHKLSQLTDFAGAVNNGAGYAAGSTSMAINELQATGTIEADQEFTIADMRGTYRVTTAASIATNAATITFYPGLESAVLDNAVITFKQSTLTPVLEPLYARLVAARCSISQANTFISQLNTAITTATNAATAIGTMAAKTTQAITDIGSGRTEAAKCAAVITTADTELDKIGAQITLAIAAVASGKTEADKIPAIVTTAATAIGLVAARVTQAVTDLGTARTAAAAGATAITLANAEFDLANAQTDLAVTALAEGEPIINTVPVGGGAGEFMGQAQSDIATARGYIAGGSGYAQEAQLDAQNASSSLGVAGGELQAGLAKINEAKASLDQAAIDARANETYIQTCVADLRNAAGYLQEAGGYFQEVSAELSTSTNYLSIAAHQLQAANTDANEAAANLKLLSSRLSIVTSSQVLTGWGRQELKDVQGELRRLTGYPTSSRYSRR